MKELIKHLLKNNIDEIVSKSLLNCHCIGLHSIMLLDSPGKTIRLFIGMPNNELCKNLPEDFGNRNMSIAFHPHHCNLTLHCVKGRILNWVVRETQAGTSVTKYKYHSKIKEGDLSFEVIGPAKLSTTKCRWINEGESSIMDAKDIHTVACDPETLSAWLVYEGIEDPNYSSFCWSNTDLNNKDITGLYLQPSKNEIIHLLKMVGLIDVTLPDKKIKKKDYWVCNRCEINSNTKSRTIPCPRGGCEAVVRGEITITKELTIFPLPTKQA